MNHVTKIAIVFCSLILLLTSSGCMMPTANLTVSPSTDFSTFNKIIVWEFKNGSVHVQNSGDIMTRAVETELMGKGFTIVPLSKVRDALGDEDDTRSNTIAFPISYNPCRP